ncbi:MAG: acyl-CoA mutase large subunit family protein [Dehalococcoidales bacterium]
MASKRKVKWEKEVLKPALKRFPERQPSYELTSGMDIKSVYTPDDLEGIDLEESIGYPGEFPFGRGIQPTMYRGRLWTMRQYSGYASAEESNRRYRYLLEQGQTGLSVAFDLPTQIGYDSDNPISRGEVGKVGVPIDTLQDMEVLFKDIPLDKVSTSMTINATAPILLAMYIVLAKRQEIPLEKLEGTIQNDILKEYIARGTYIYPPVPSMRLTTDIFEYCSKNMPRWNTISISGYHIREAGSTAVQEVSFTLADGIAYVQAALDKGLNIEDFAGRLSFFFDAHNNLLEEVAKFRAARILWAEIMKQRFHAKDPRSCMLRFHTQTAGCALTAQQPYNNIVRVAVQALAAVLGGTQSLHTNSYDEAYATPSEEAVTTALRTQQMLAYESGAADSVDPLGGAFMVESLTQEIKAAAQKYIEKIDSLGGALKAIEKGFPQREIQESSYRYQQEVEAEKRIIVGVNKFVDPYSKIKSLLRVDPTAEKKQVTALKKVKQERNSKEVAAALENLKKVALSKENTIPAFIRCVESYATIGEICDTLRIVFGLHKESLIF